MSDTMRNRNANLGWRCRSSLIGSVAAMSMAAATGRALGQDASLLQAPQVAGPSQVPLTLENSSFMYQMLPPEAELRELRVNDIITVLVDYSSSMASNGNAENRKTSNLNAELKNWLKFDGKNLTPAPQNHGDLKVDGQVDSQFRVDSSLQSKDSLTFRIAVRVVDIQPNGNLVIEGHRDIHDQRRSLAAIADGHRAAIVNRTGSHGSQRRNRRSANHKTRSGLYPRQLCTRLVYRMVRQVEAVLGRVEG